MNKQLAGLARKALEDKLAGKVGLLDVIIGRGTFDDGEVTFKVTLREAGAQTPERKYFIAFAQYLDGLQASDIDRIFTANGRSFRITGMKSRGRRCITAVDVVSGAPYVFPVEAVRKAFGLSAVKS